MLPGDDQATVISSEVLEQRQLLSATNSLNENELVDLLQNFGPETIASSVDGYLANLQTQLEETIEPVTELPVVGDQIGDGFQPFFDVLTGLRDDLQSEIREAFESTGLASGVNLVESLQTSFYGVFGPGGLDILLDGSDTGTDISTEDVRFTFGVDSDDSGEVIDQSGWVQWDVHLGQQLITDLPFDVGIGLDNILDFDASGEVRFDLQWDLRAGFGVTQQDAIIGRPFLNSGAEDERSGDDVPELKMSVDVYAAPAKDVYGNDLPFSPDAPGLQAGATVGLLRGQLTDGTDEVVTVTGTQPVDLESSALIDTEITVELEHAEFTDPVRFDVVLDNTPFNLLLPTLNAELNAEAMSALGSNILPLSVIPEIQSLNPFEENFGASLKMIARTPEITSIRIINGGELGFEESADAQNGQGDDLAARHLGFANQQSANGTLTASDFAPSNGQVPHFLELFLQVDETWVDLSLREADFQSTAEDIESLDDLVTVVQEHANDRLTRAGFTPEDGANFVVSTVDGRLQFTATSALTGSATAPTLTVGFQEQQTTRLSLMAGVDLRNDEFDEDLLDADDQSTFNRVYLADIGFDSFQLAFEADAQIRLQVDTGADHISDFAEQALGAENGSLGLPSISFDLELDANVTRTDDGDYETNYGYQQANGEYRDSFVFANVQLDVGELLETVAVPIANTLGDVVGPLGSIIGDGSEAASSLLQEPLPLVDVTLAEILGEDLTSGIDGILDALGSLGSFTENIGNFLDTFEGDPIDFGSFEYNLTTGLLIPREVGEVITSTAQIESGLKLGEFLDVAPVNVDTGGFSVDLLSFDSIANMLIGKPFDIISFDLPSLDFEAELDIGFEFFGGLVGFDFGVGGGIHIADLGLGYDSSGLAKIMDAYRNDEDPNWADLIDGVYLKNAEGPEVQIEVGGNLGIALGFTADVYLETFLELDLQDPNEDGKFRLDEIFELTNDFSDPENLICAFDIAGGLDAGLSVDFGLFDYEGDFSGSLSLQGLLENLLGVDCAALNEPILATPIDRGREQVLRINTGTYANERLFGDTNDDTDQVLRIEENSPNQLSLIASDGTAIVYTRTGSEYVTEEDNSTIKKIGSAYRRDFNNRANTYQAFRSDGRIEEQNDRFDRKTTYRYTSSAAGDQLLSITTDRGVGANDRVLEFEQGANITVTQSGSDIIVTGFGAEPQTYTGPFDRIEVSGGELADHLDLSGVRIPVRARGFGGNDTLRGGSAADNIDGGDGADSLFGNSGNDTIRGGDGNDEIHGGAGDDDLYLGTGINTVTDGSGSDLVDARRSGAGIRITLQGSGDVVRGTAFDDIINAAASGSATIDARAGNDHITVSSGNNIVRASDGHDTITALGGQNRLLGGSGDDAFVLSAASSGSLEGGVGQNQLVLDEEGTQFDTATGYEVTLSPTELQIVGHGTTAYAGINDGIILKLSESLDDLSFSGATTAVTVSGGGGLTNIDSQRASTDSGAVVLGGADGIGRLSVPGHPDLAFDNANQLTVELGDSGDEVLIESTQAASTIIRTQDGNDRITVDSMQSPLTIDGGNDFDTITIGLTDPLSGYADLAVTAEVLQVDGSELQGDRDWDFVDGIVSVSAPVATGGQPVEIVDTLGADRVLIRGRDGAIHHVTATDTVDTRQDVTIQADHLQISEGFDVLTPASTINQVPEAFTVTVDGLDNVYDAAFSPDDQHLYTVARGDNRIGVFRRTESGGLWFEQQVAVPLEQPSFVEVSADGKHVYVSDPISLRIDIYARDTRTGRLSRVGRYTTPSNFAEGNGRIVTSPDGGSLYVASGQIVRRLSRNAQTGQLLQVEAQAIGIGFVSDLTVTSSGNTLFATGTSGTRKINVASDGSLANSTRISQGGNGIAVSDNGYIALATDASISTYSTSNLLLNDEIESTYSADVESVAIQPGTGNVQIIAGQDPTTASTPASRFTAQIIHVEVVDRSEGGTNGDEPYITIAGRTGTIWSATRAFSGSTFTHDSSQYDFTGDTLTFELKEDDGDSGDDYLGDTTVVKFAGDVTRTISGSSSGNAYNYKVTIRVREFAEEQNDAPEIRVLQGNTRGGLLSPSNVNVPQARFPTRSVAVDSSGIGVAALSSGDQLRVIPQNGGNVRISQGEHQNVMPAAVGPNYSETVMASDGVLYTVNSLQGVIFVDRAGQEPTQIVVAGLADEASIALSTDGTQVYVSNPTLNQLLVFTRDGIGNLTQTQTFTDGQGGVSGLGEASAIQVIGDDVYVVGRSSGSIALFRQAGDLEFVADYSAAGTGTLGGTALSADGARLFVIDDDNDRVIEFERDGSTGALTERGSFATVGRAVSIHHSQVANSEFLLIGMASDAIAVWLRQNDASFRQIQQVENNRLGVRGLDGLKDLEVSPGGGFLFAAGQDASSVMVFGIDSETGLLTPVQRLRNNAGGVSGLDHLSSLSFVDGTLLASSAEFGVVRLSATLQAPELRSYDLALEDVTSLEVNTADRSDTVSVFSPSVPTTINTNAGTDLVLINHLSTEKRVTVNLGADDDSLEVRMTALNSNLTVNGEAGGDSFRMTNTDSAIVSGGTGDDTFFVDGTSVTGTEVRGDSGSDTLYFDTKGPTTVPDRNNGATGASGQYDRSDSLQIVGSGSPATHYEDFEFVFRIAAPNVRITADQQISEGQSIHFTASDAVGADLYEWDLNGDGVFDDASGLSASLAWDDLNAVGINDDGVYPVAIRAVNELGTDTDIAFLTISNQQPEIDVNGATAMRFQPFPLTLSANDPADDTVIGYTIDWGDGTEPVAVAGETAAVSHVYLTGGSFEITITATDEDGAYQKTQSVSVIDGPPPRRTLVGANAAAEGSSYQLRIEATGPLFPGLTSSWLVDWGDGSTSMATGNTPSLNHTYADDGVYRITGVQTYENGFVVIAENLQTVRVGNVVPKTTFNGAATSTEGAAYSLNGIRQVDTDPGDDSISSWIVNWGDGTSTSFESNPGSAAHIYTDDGTYEVSISVIDEDGQHVSDTTLVVEVTNVAPQLTVTPAAPEAHEGQLYHLLLESTDPGTDRVRQWKINWGDGSPEQTFVPGAVALHTPFAEANQTSAAHRYADGEANYVITVTAVDEDGSHVATQSVAVKDSLPSGTIKRTTTATVFEAEPLTISLNASDPGSGIEDVIDGWTINWGDGTEPEFLAGDATNASHIYGDDGNYVITATIQQGTEQISVPSLTATIVDMEPALTLTAEPQLSPQTPFRLNLGDVVDPGDDAIGEYRVYWGDGSLFDGQDYQSFSRGGSVEHTYEDPSASFTLSVMLVDADEADRVTFGGVIEVVPEGTTFSLPVAVPTVANGMTVVEWGDGRSNVYSLADVQPWLSEASAATEQTRLNELDNNAIAYTHGDVIRASYQTIEGIEQFTDIDVSADTTLGHLLSQISSATAGSTATLVDGRFLLIDDATDTLLPVTLTDQTVTITSSEPFQRRTNWAPQIVATHQYSDNAVHTVLVFDESPAGTRTRLQESQLIVNNQAPIASVNLPATVEAGTIDIQDLLTFTDDGFSDSISETVETFTYSIAWGDGSEPVTGTATVDQPGAPGTMTVGSADGTHRYRDVGSFTVTVTVTDDDGASSTASGVVEITNVAPVLTRLSVTANKEGETTILSGRIVDPGALDTFTLMVDWGAPDSPDNIETYTFSSAAMGFQDFQLNHQYLDDDGDDRYPVSLSIVDSFNEGNAYTIEAELQNSDPMLEDLTATAIVENGVTTLSGTIFDSGVQDTFTLDIVWGDPTSPNNSERYTFSASETGRQTFELTHQYYDDNAADSFTIQLQLSDDDGGFTTAQTNVSVTNAAPSLDAGDDQTVNENSIVDISSIFSDPGRFDTHSATIDWGDGTEEVAGTVSGAPLASGVTDTVWGSHTYADDGQYTVTVQVTDKDGGVATDSLVVTVLNVEPTLSAGPDQSAAEGEFLTLAPTTFSDPGFDFGPAGTTEDFEAVIDWGDGTIEPLSDVTLIDNEDGTVGVSTTGSISASHAYGDNGTYTVTVRVRDDDMDEGEWVSDSFQVHVDNVAPIIDRSTLQNSAPGFGGANEGEAVTVSIDFKDAGFDQAAAGTREAFTQSSIDWGDGTVTSARDLELTKRPGAEGLETTGTLGGTHRYEHGGVYHVTATVSDDDSGSDSVTTTVQVTGIGIVDRTLYVVGTDGRDFSKVWFNERQNTVSVYAHLNRHGWLGLRGQRISRTYSLDDVDQIVSLLGDGHDQFLMHDGYRRRAVMTLPVTVDSGAGNDVIITGAGHDTIDAGDGHNRIWSGSGNDRITTGSGNDHLEAGGGDDIIDAGRGSNFVDTGHGNDTVSTGDGNDCIHAPSGNNIIDSGSGHDWLRTGDGEDRIDSGSGDDVIHSGGGNDLILGRSGNDHIDAGDGDDIVVGGTGRDRIYGSRGQDLLIAGTIDASTDQLDDLFADWNASMDFFDRVQSLQDGRGQLGAPLVKLVADDDARDVVHGGSGRDWVLATRLGRVTDQVRTKRNDLFTEIPNEDAS